MANSSMEEETPEVSAQVGEQTKKIQAPTAIADRQETIRDQIRRVPFRLTGNWLIGSTIVAVGPAALIEGTPAVGRQAVVTATRGADGVVTAAKIVIHEPQPTPAPRFGYVLSPFGALAALSVFLPLTLLIYDYLPGYGGATILMTEILCFGAYAFAYMGKRSLWEGALRRSVRGARGTNMRAVAAGALGISLFLGFFVAMGGLTELDEWLPELLTRFALPLLKMAVYLGFTLFCSIMAALQYMAGLEGRGAYLRPLNLHPDVDLAGIGMGSIESGLGIPAGVEWKIIERKSLPSGGVWFILQWMETTIRALPNGERKEILQEKTYEVNLSVGGQVISYAERT